MKKLIIIIFFLSIVSCNGKNKVTGRPAGNDTAGNMPEPDSLVAPPYTWEPVRGTGNNKLIINKTPASPISLKLADVLEKLNKKYAPLKIKLVKTSGDTLFVDLRPGKILTREMGSTGADIYMTEATLNLCKVPDIHYVHYNFPAGDHATPGTYSKRDFRDEGAGQ